MPVFALTNEIAFPPPELAEADGLLAVGGDLSPHRLVAAYRLGIFPWYSADDPILWWSPSPRLILTPHLFHLSKRLARTMRQGRFTVTMDTAFRRVVTACAHAPRKGQSGTWIVPEMVEAYCALHAMGIAHSVECHAGPDLVGGLYGVALGHVFFGESMFSVLPDTSKITLAVLCRHLAAWNFTMIDCQMTTPHLVRLGAVEIDKKEFRTRLAHGMRHSHRPGPWTVMSTLMDRTSAPW